MTALSIPSFSSLFWSRLTARPETDQKVLLTNEERRKVVNQVIASGACDSEHGVQMLMSVYPDQF